MKPGPISAVLVSLRYCIYIILMLGRMPLGILSRLVWPLIGFGIVWGFAAGWSSPACLWMTGSGTGLFVVGFLFETLLLWVSPERIYLET